MPGSTKIVDDRIVVDASSVGAFLLRDEGDKSSGRIERLASELSITAPAHWPIEVLNLVLKARRRRRIDADEYRAVRSDALLLLEATTVEQALPERVLALAEKHTLSAYDAAYLEIASRLRLPLLSLDRALRRAAEAESVVLP